MPIETQSSPFLNRVRDAIRVRHYSIRTEQSYVSWIKRMALEQFIYPMHLRENIQMLRKSGDGNTFFLLGNEA